jgi:phosphatidate cytidylyltransferase
MLRQRLLFGTLLIVLVAALFWVDQWLGAIDISGTWPQRALGGRAELPAGIVLAGAFAVLAVLAARELAAIYRAKGIEVSRLVLVLGAVATCVVMYLSKGRDGSGGGAEVATLGAAVLICAMIAYAVPRKRTAGAAAAGAAAMFGWAYLGLLPGFYLLLRHDHSAWVVAGTIFVVKQCDTGAYFTGKALGRHKLIPWLSPGKTVEGLIGGLALSAATAVLFVWIGNRYGHTDMPLWYAAVTGAVIGGVGCVGDLLESLLKRDAGVKDSGTLIPGMGGVLDVLDSPLLAAPVAYWMIAGTG